ncbi:MAG: 4'-phosphopantetheinyl transferase family protein [Lachnospiraceae bacterium]
MKNRVYIARTDALNDESVFRRLYNAASPERRRKTDDMYFRKDKMLSLAAEALLRKSLDDMGLTDSIVIYGKNGKPYIAGNDIFFSLSHSEKTVMCAISQSEIGADTEKVTEIDLDIAKHFFHPAEYEMLAGAPGDAQRQDIFFRLWTLKESFAKVLGLGMHLPFDSFCIDIQDGNISVWQDINNEKYCFKEYELNDGYKYSVCSLSWEYEDMVRCVALENL